MRYNYYFLAASYLATAASPTLCYASEQASLPSTSGPFYFRADLGTVIANKISGTYIPSYKSSAKVTDGSALAMIGIGYRWNDYLRTDITLSHTPKLTFTTTSKKDGLSFYATQHFHSTSIMVNGYADLITWNGFTPYIMAGAGLTLNKSQKFDHYVTIPEDEEYFAHTLYSYKNGQSNYNFSWQIGAGISYQFTSHLALDVNYRFIDLGKVKNGSVYTRSDQTTSYLPPDHLKLHSHALTIGLRYNF